MKLLNNYPGLSRFVLTILLFAGSLIIGALIDRPFLKRYFPFVPAILLLLSTWILFKTDGKSLKAVGLNLNLRNVSFLPLGLIIGAIAFLAAKYARAVYIGESIAISDSMNFSTMLYAFYTILPTVAVEELLFRGYLFKKTIEKSNVIKANVIFSVLFMLIHVLDGDVMQNKGLILLLAVSIPVGHLLFATALLKSKTLFFPIGLHLGNNWATRHLVSNSNNGESIFYITDVATFETWIPFIMVIMIFNGVFLLVTCLIWKWNDLVWIKNNRFKL